MALHRIMGGNRTFVPNEAVVVLNLGSDEIGHLFKPPSRFKPVIIYKIIALKTDYKAFS